MKSTSIIFITLNSIDKHLLHTSQMHTHAYTWRVQDSEPYSGIQRRRECLWTLVDPDMYMRCVDIFLYYSLCFSSLILFQKDFINPHIIDNHMTDFPHHHSIMYDFTPPIFSFFSQHSPVICKDFFPLIHMYKSSRYYAVFHIDLGPMCSNYRVEIGAVGIKNLEDLANRIPQWLSEH